MTGGQDTVGLRVPDHPVAQALLAELGPARAVAAPSANRFGRISPTTAAHVKEELGEAADMILDGGPCRVGLESTIVGFDGNTPVILRPGGILNGRVMEIVGKNVVRPSFYDANSARIGLAGIALRTCHAIGTLARRVAMQRARELEAGGARVARGDMVTSKLISAGVGKIKTWLIFSCPGSLSATGASFMRACGSVIMKVSTVCWWSFLPTTPLEAMRSATACGVPAAVN